jgi:UDP-N-acetylmuramate--alanine ligase
MKKPSSLRGIKEIHFTGIKGVGMTALACCAQDLGLKITGSDVKEVFVTDEVLKKRKIRWKTGFSPKNIKKPDLVITTGAHQGFANPEVKEAQAKNIRSVSHAEALGLFAVDKETVSVCGVGGKTTTASMIATILTSIGQKPSFAIGVGQINPLGDPGRYASGRHFVAEADEYAVLPGQDHRPRFSFQKPKVITVTNIEHDHPDIYEDLSQTKKTFENFFESLPPDGLLIACIDNPNIADLLRQGLTCPVQTYGFSPRADWQIEKINLSPGKTFFTLSRQGMEFGRISLSVPGRFNCLNAVAAFAAVNFLGGDPRKIKSGLEKFAGTKRRFELLAQVKKMRLYDDYAHHPTQIQATLKAAREWFPDQPIVAVFQPHTFSRTKVLFNEFAKSFALASQTLITDIYASAREEPIPGVSSQKLASAIQKNQPKVSYCPGIEEVLDYLKKHLSGNEVILTLGAGDIFLWRKKIIKLLKNL